jgi:putative ABC transport system substrate-binding protein
MLGGAAAAWPVLARAQQPERMRRLGVLMNIAADDADAPVRVAAFAQGLQELGWTVGRNVRIDYRWGVGDTDRHRRNAAELIAQAPDVILAHGSPIVGVLRRATRSEPIVFVSVADPVGGGFVTSLAQPGGNATGFTNLEYGLSGKWLELLKQIVPQLTRAAVLRDADQVSGGGQLGAMQSVASSLRVELNPIDVRDRAEIERAVTAFALQPNGGLVMTATAWGAIHRDLIIALAARYRLPAVYPYRFFVSDGGLISYGPDTVDQYRRAAGYVDRILRGEKPAHLPVQAPVKYETVINLKTAKALGLTVPDTVLARADEVIE